MNSGFLITDVGAAAASVANPTGPFIHITQFKIGTGVGYTATRAQTDLIGTTVYTGVASGYSVVSDDTIEVLLIMDATVGPFDFGEIGLYLDSGELFAISVFESLQEKTRAIGNQAGSVWKIRARLKFAQAPVVCQVTLVNSQSILEVPGFQFLQKPVDQLMNANVAIVHANNSSDDPVLVIRDNDNEWGLVDYSRSLLGATTDPSAALTATTFSHPGLSSLYFEGMPRTDSRYLIKTPDGSIRKITGSSSPTSVTFDPAVTPSAGPVSIWTEGGGNSRVSWADTHEYNSFIELFNTYWSRTIGPYRVAIGFTANYPVGNKGSGQTAFVPLTRRTTPDDWQALVTAVKALCELHNINTTALDSIVDFVYRPVAPHFYGMEALRLQWQAMMSSLTQLEANRNVFNPAALEQLQLSTYTNNSYWTTTRVFSHTFTYLNEGHLQALMNSGHEIKMSAVVTSTVDPEWNVLASLFASIGTVTAKHDVVSGASGTPTGIGLHQLSTTYQNLFSKSAGGFYGNNWTVTLRGRQRPSFNDIQLDWVITRQYVSMYVTPTPNPGLITFRSFGVRPSPAILANPVLPYPTPSFLVS